MAKWYQASGDVVVVAMNVAKTTHQSVVTVVWLEVMLLKGMLIDRGWLGAVSIKWVSPIIFVCVPCTHLHICPISMSIPPIKFLDPALILSSSATT